MEASRESTVSKCGSLFLSKTRLTLYGPPCEQPPNQRSYSKAHSCTVALGVKGITFSMGNDKCTLVSGGSPAEPKKPQVPKEPWEDVEPRAEGQEGRWSCASASELLLNLTSTASWTPEHSRPRQEHQLFLPERL